MCFKEKNYNSKEEFIDKLTKEKIYAATTVSNITTESGNINDICNDEKLITKITNISKIALNLAILTGILASIISGFIIYFYASGNNINILLPEMFEKISLNMIFLIFSFLCFAITAPIILTAFGAMDIKNIDNKNDQNENMDNKKNKTKISINIFNILTNRLIWFAEFFAIFLVFFCHFRKSYIFLIIILIILSIFNLIYYFKKSNIKFSINSLFFFVLALSLNILISSVLFVKLYQNNSLTFLKWIVDNKIVEDILIALIFAFIYALFFALVIDTIETFTKNHGIYKKILSIGGILLFVVVIFIYISPNIPGNIMSDTGYGDYYAKFVLKTDNRNNTDLANYANKSSKKTIEKTSAACKYFVLFNSGNTFFVTKIKPSNSKKPKQHISIIPLSIKNFESYYKYIKPKKNK